MPKLQQNPKTGQVYLGLPKQISLAMDLNKGQQVSIRVVDSRTLQIRKEND